MCRMNIIETKKLTKRYGNKEVVSGINLLVEQGDTFGLLGPNGAGKSTTISMLVGLVKPTSGDILIKGINTKNKAEDVRHYIGLVPQDIALYPTLTAEDNLRFWGRMYGIRGKKLKSRVEEVLEIVNLEEKRKDKIETYSGGMKRRINIAAALLHEPEIIIMDEPTVGIDPQSRNHILETVKSLNKLGTTIIYTSHYMEEVEFLCNKVAIIDNGKVIASDEKEKLKKSIIDSEKLILELSAIPKELNKEIQSVEEVIRLVTSKNNVMEIYVHNGAQAFVKILTIILRYNIKIVSSKIEEPNLETVFLKLTGKTLRD